MTKLKIDYSDARDWYVTGDKEENGYSYPSLSEIPQKQIYKDVMYKIH